MVLGILDDIYSCKPKKLNVELVQCVQTHLNMQITMLRKRLRQLSFDVEKEVQLIVLNSYFRKEENESELKAEKPKFVKFLRDSENIESLHQKGFHKLAELKQLEREYLHNLKSYEADVDKISQVAMVSVIQHASHAMVGLGTLLARKFLQPTAQTELTPARLCVLQ